MKFWTFKIKTNLDELTKVVYILSTYLKSPAQSHSSTSHTECLLPLDRFWDSNSSILKKKVNVIITTTKLNHCNKKMYGKISTPNSIYLTPCVGL